MLRPRGRMFGLLVSIQPDEECQIAQIGQDLIVLPQYLDLSGYVGKSISMIRVDFERYCVRLLA
jgi:hypothetical protein